MVSETNGYESYYELFAAMSMGVQWVQVKEIAESLQQVKHKGGSCPPIRTLGMGDVTGDCRIFATCNPFQGF